MKKRPLRFVPSYSPIEIAMASTSQPMPKAKRDQHVALIRAGLEAMRSAPVAGPNDWRPVSDCVNIIETLIELGWLEDADGCQADAERALAEAGTRHLAGKPLRLDGPGLEACDQLLMAYEEVIGIISDRNLKTAFVKTERRVWEITHGIARRAHDRRMVSV